MAKTFNRDHNNYEGTRFYAGIMHENYHRRLPTPPSSNPLAEEIAVAVRLDNGNYVA